MNTGCNASKNPSEETISESSQITKLQETINEEVMFSVAQQKHLHLSLPR